VLIADPKAQAVLRDYVAAELRIGGLGAQWA